MNYIKNVEIVEKKIIEINDDVIVENVVNVVKITTTFSFIHILNIEFENLKTSYYQLNHDEIFEIFVADENDVADVIEKIDELKKT